ncbi:ras-like protein [Mycena sanguinolenta]|nr:ras-like protein [Mycena sanguinolenta]
MTTTSPAQVARKEHTYTLLMVGEGGVGKMTLMYRFTYGHFCQEIDPTLDEVYRKRLVVDDECVVVDTFNTDTDHGHSCGLLDHVGQIEAGFVLVYSITQRSTFERIRTHHRYIRRTKDLDVSAAIIIVANKCDLEAWREVSMQEGRDLAEELGCTFMETSAKEGVNVEEAFIDVIRQMLRSKKSKPGEPQDVKAGGEGEHTSRCSGCAVL